MHAMTFGIKTYCESIRFNLAAGARLVVLAQQHVVAVGYRTPTVLGYGPATVPRDEAGGAGRGGGGAGGGPADDVTVDEGRWDGPRYGSFGLLNTVARGKMENKLVGN